MNDFVTPLTDCLVKSSRAWQRECFGTTGSPFDGDPRYAYPELRKVDDDTVLLVKRWEAFAFSWTPVWFATQRGQEEFPGVVLIPWHTLSPDGALKRAPYRRLVRDVVKTVKASRGRLRCFQLPSCSAMTEPNQPLVGHEIRKVSDADDSPLLSAGFVIAPERTNFGLLTERIHELYRQETGELWMWQCFRRCPQSSSGWQSVRTSVEACGALFSTVAEAMADARRFWSFYENPCLEDLPVLRSFGAGSSWSAFF